ncbi:hypothetical protein SECTIM467_129 [Brevibacillus phage SecTim467]|uniref:Uncharacterized protein n=2 Tax=Jenstvirus jenst TaxID=1982225 RepID=A0A0K2CPC1_9CAUD|nr:hypothetical protein AVV11_gp067 [Brevibacillus phage Jenst]ALA07253.1 hypothetical protein JENST_124 [Brevibacillus phage Jenst]ALA07455.1 hypothetical protein SECTIM467_129 [Brevibacillus phage SecTim467]
MGIIFRTYEDTEVASLYAMYTNVKCPYCGQEQQELDVDNFGKTYIIECDGCDKQYQMYFG